MEKALVEQRQALRAVERTLVNLGKLGQKNITAVVVKNRLAILNSNWNRCQQLDVILHTIATEEEKKTETYFTTDEFLKGEEAFLSTSDELEGILAKYFPVIHTTPQVATAPGGNQIQTAQPQLPRLPLPKFSGKYSEWQNFHDLFESLVITPNQLPKVQMLQYLKQSLTGEASLVLKNVKPTEANYASAWATLKERYDNPRALINAYLQDLDNISVVKSESAPELRKLRDTTNDALTALKNLNRSVDTWDDVLVFKTVQRLDMKTRKEWELQLGDSKAYPTYKQLDTFLATRIRALENCIPAIKLHVGNNENSERKKTRDDNTRAHVSTEAEQNCYVCEEIHPLYQCQQFKISSLGEKQEIVKKNRCCFNCLRSGHFPRNCPSKRRCSRCHRKHHTLLHDENIKTGASKETRQPGVVTQEELPSTSQTVSALASREMVRGSRFTLLATASVRIRTHEGRSIVVRALIDPGSESTFVTDSVIQTLRAQRRRANIKVSGIGGQLSGVVHSLASLIIMPCHGKGPALTVDALVFQRLTSYTPAKVNDLSQWEHLRGLEWADVDRSNEDSIDLLIGADVYGSLLRDGLRQGPPGTPTAQLTIFGWIVSGPMLNANNNNQSSISVFHSLCEENTEELLKRFWEIEELPKQSHLTDEEQRCEAHFVSTHTRTSTGRYIVRLPFKEGPPIDIGSSFGRASMLYEKLERRLSRNPDLTKEYNKFLADYERLGHMAPVESIENSVKQAVYLPHHPVIREDSTTTRLRVVFNASSITGNGTSLNDHMLTGPRLQADLPSIIMRWRQYRYVYTADITKMFRQILVHPDDADYQIILWRPQAEARVLSYRLLTVTYGTASAPYLSIRVLRQLACDERERFPLSARVLEQDFYVDDCLFGADDFKCARETQKQLTALLAAGGFHLSKWAANHNELLNDVPLEDQNASLEQSLSEDSSIKILGIAWNPCVDNFHFNIQTPRLSTKITKRNVLSAIARLYDPLGWVSPIVITAKELIQRLWLKKMEWDEPLSVELKEEWRLYCEQLPLLQQVTIPRWTCQEPSAQTYEIHGFADASGRAYAGAVYLRVIHSADKITTSLIMSKSKVAPVKTVSIPRLELCAASLLTNVINHVRKAMNLENVPTYCWTDSTTVLDWLSQHASKWQTFVANRVASIQTKLPDAKWRYVPSLDNPADCASRGVSVPELLAHSLWWAGPPWLRKHSTSWPLRGHERDSDASYEKRSCKIHIAAITTPEWDLLDNISSWPRLLRVTAYCKKFVSRLRSSVRKGESQESRSLNSNDIQQARNYWIKYAQSLNFQEDISHLKNKQNLPRKSQLRSLNPFLDNEGLLRVGGRLRNAPLPYDEKHPIILPRHRVSDLIIEQAHLRSLHGGPQLTLRIIRQNYWILGARNSVKSHIHSCIRCVREKAVTPSQLMGDLPRSRVTPARPFLHSGVDYAGPVQVSLSTGRGKRANKAYIAVFVCLTTRAVHLELVSDYSTVTFLAAFRRFASRRGIPANIYSDNGTNFRGADKELTQAWRAATRDYELVTSLASDGTDWHFIPAAAPHFGGLWEAGVKSMKHHLKRVIGAHILSIEESTTLLTQIEACLNSRPIAPLTEAPDDFSPLTPGHFLIGAPLVTTPERSVLEINEGRLSRWQRVRRMFEQFWRIWMTDYLNALQQRYKWQTEENNVKINELVLIRNNQLPPSKWELGRICETHPGPDGHTRVVTVKTATTKRKRPITQLCRLPIDVDDSKQSLEPNKAGGAIRD